MFSQKDLAQIAGRGSDVRTVEDQVKRFRKGFPWLKIVAPATVGRGIEVLSEEQLDEACAYSDSAEVAGRCKFVPASGAASRMFKDIFAGMDTPNAAVERLSENISSFAFYSPEVFPQGANVASRLLTEEGLGYGSKPKGVLKFHRYQDGEVRTALAEHLVEGQEYMRENDGTVRLVFTISPEHTQLFEEALAEVKDEYEKRYGVKYDITFTYQDKSTDTIAVDENNEPFRTEDGSLLFRPAGHGALIHNLNEVYAEIVSIKNIDNVACERLLPVTARYKKALMGRCLQLRDQVRGFLRELEMATAVHPYIIPDKVLLPGYNNTIGVDPALTPECQSLCDDIEDFLREEFCVEISHKGDARQRVEEIRRKLDRPIRVCGMVRNLGEPGGGPFIVEDSDGSTSLQILESVQINPNDPAATESLKNASHFNPVDLVCCLRNASGEKFDLLSYVDTDAGFISSKSYQGRPLKALELPGLWNGSMSDWNTKFVEVPVDTFNPVKVVLDLLRPAHQQ